LDRAGVSDIFIGRRDWSEMEAGRVCWTLEEVKYSEAAVVCYEQAQVMHGCSTEFERLLTSALVAKTNIDKSFQLLRCLFETLYTFCINPPPWPAPSQTLIFSPFTYSLVSLSPLLLS
jgi:hypothetical protein